MPKSRGSDLSQRQSPRTPLPLKMTGCSEANALHRPAAAVDRSSPNVEDRRSNRSPLAPLHEKKRSVKVADLETKLGRAQEELGKLRDQLVSAEAAKHDAEQALQKAKKQIPALAHNKKDAEEEKLAPAPPSSQESAEKISRKHEFKAAGEGSASSGATTDAFEIEALSDPVQEFAGNYGQEQDVVTTTEEEESEVDATNGDASGSEALEGGNNEDKDEDARRDRNARGQEVVDLKAKLLEKEREVEFLLEENAISKKRAKEAADKIAAAARVKEHELEAKLRSMEEELKESRAKAGHLEEQLGAAEGTKATLEAELKRLKVQTGQWRKAAEAAAAALTSGDGIGGDHMGGSKVAKRCVSMDKHGWESPLMAGDMEDDVAVGGGRRKAGGIRMFGDIWKKKGQQK